MSQGGAVVLHGDVVVGDINTAGLIQLDAVVAPLETFIPEVPLPGATEESHQLTLLDVPPGEESLPRPLLCGVSDVDMQHVPQVTDTAVFCWDVSAWILESQQSAVCNWRNCHIGQAEAVEFQRCRDTFSTRHHLPPFEGSKDTQEEAGIEIERILVSQLTVSVFPPDEEAVSLPQSPDGLALHPELEVGAAGRDVPVVAGPGARLVEGLSPASLLVGLSDPAGQLVTDKVPLVPVSIEQLQHAGPVSHPVPEGGGEGGAVGKPGVPRAVRSASSVQAACELGNARPERGSAAALLTADFACRPRAGLELFLQLK